ncbi:hypothetical protein [Leclercia sp. UBA5958]|uniref:hypothetical protein n=1 Tax=Leclercia sp. UBA5958 TaxID=1946742 RepID=UPI00257AEEE4|nr:hypothetical protein [Leclercia sp. UBA5958]
MTAILSSGWESILGIAGVVIALLFSWFGGKSKGATTEKAKADVAAANETAKQSQAATDKQAEVIKVAKNAEQTNQSLSDDASRERMRQSKYHSDD